MSGQATTGFYSAATTLPSHISQSPSGGQYDTAVGYTTGLANTAVGYLALTVNSAG
jgi:hypothetical protein